MSAVTHCRLFYSVNDFRTALNPTERETGVERVYCYLRVWRGNYFFPRKDRNSIGIEVPRKT